MNWLTIVLILIIGQGIAYGYPIHASNEAINCTVFGEFKNNYLLVEPNEDRNIILNLDVSLIRSNTTGISPVQATYFLVDRNDKTYPTRDDLTFPLGPGRQLLGFAVTPETVPKTLIVIPSGIPQAGSRLVVDFGDLISATNGKVNVQYYGVLDTKSKSNLRYLDFDLGITNNGTGDIPLSMKNFSLIDQRGWRYPSPAYNAYTYTGFPDRDINPKEMARIKVSFGPLSPLSMPSRLVYNYSNTSSMVLVLDSEVGMVQNVTASKNCSCKPCKPCGDSAPTPKPPAVDSKPVLASKPMVTSAEVQAELAKLAGSLKATRGVLKTNGTATDNFIKNNIHMVGGNGTRQRAVIG